MASREVPTTQHRYFVPSQQLTRGRNDFTIGNYQGDPTNIGIHIPEHKNTSLWITGLPQIITYPQMLGYLKTYKVGRIRSLVINEPTETSHTSAATISFFRREDAEGLYRLIQEQGLVIPGAHPRVCWNRFKVMEMQGPGQDRLSRVLLITGPPSQVNPGYLTEFLKDKFSYQLDTIVDHGIVDGEDGPVSQLEYRFASWRSQAQFGRMAIEMELRGIIHVEYGIDPCAV